MKNSYTKLYLIDNGESLKNAFAKFPHIAKEITTKLLKEEQATRKKISAQKLGEFLALNHIGEREKARILKKKITLKEAKEKAIEKAFKNWGVYYFNQLKKLERTAQVLEEAKQLKRIKISIDWKKSSVWGYNPRATVWGGGYYNEGSASGCGYDKESAAIAEAVYNFDKLTALLCALEEKRLKAKEPQSRRDFIGYGSGCDYVPALEGGVGASCHVDILKRLGFSCVQFHGDTFDGYEFTKKE